MELDRIRFVEHKGRQVFVIDLCELIESEVLPVLIEAAKKVRAFPPASLLTLTDATTLQFSLRNHAGDYDRMTSESIRNCIAGNRPYVKAAAIAIGSGESKRVIVEFFNRAGDRQFETFDSAEHALDWLVEQ